MADPNAIDSIISVIQRCRECKDLRLARSIYAMLCEDSFESHHVLGNYLVSLMIDCECLTSARYSFDRLTSCKNRYAWSSLISGYIDCGEPMLAFELYEKMKEERVQAKNFTYRALLKGCIALRDCDTGREIHSSLIKEGLDQDHFIGSVVVDVYGKCGFFLDAVYVFENLPVQDVVLWTNLLSSYAEQGFVEGVLDCLERMYLSGILPDSRTFVCSLKACSITRMLDIGQKIHEEIVILGLEKEMHVSHTIVDMYAKCGSLLEGRVVFEQLPVRTVIPWTSLITGYADNGLIEEVIILLESMKREGVPPVSITLLCIFKACSIDGQALGTGREMHSLALKMGFEMDESVGTSLIDMYSKCGSFLEAWVVLSQLSSRGSAAWNALISGCAEHGLVEEVLNSLSQMQKDGVSPVAITFLCCLKACSARAHLQSGRRMHSEIVKLGLERELDVHNSVIDMYVKCDMIGESEVLFDRLLIQNVVAWATLITGYAEKGMYNEVMEKFEEMQMVFVNLDLVAHICSLTACGMVRAIDKGKSMHVQLVKMGVESELTLANALVDMYMKCNRFEEAWAVFNRLLVRSATIWLALSVGYEDHGFSENALNCFNRMQLDGFVPCNAMYSTALKACGRIRMLQTGQEIHDQVIQRGLEIEADVGNALVGMYSHCGLFIEAHKSFDKLSKDEVLWQTLIVGYAENGFAEEAVCNLERMRMGGFVPSAKAYISTLKACSMGYALLAGQQIHIELVKRGLNEDIYITTTLVDMYAKCGLLNESRGVLNKQPIPGVAAWNALIAAYVDHGLGDQALECFKSMRLEGVLPGTITYACAVEACGIMQALEMGCQIHMEITKRALETDTYIGSALIGMYGKCGVILEAAEVFNQLPVRDVPTWNAMIKANGENHEGKLASHCFEEMQKQGVNPDGITFICLLAACCHSRHVSKGMKYFELMLELGIRPTWDHHTCIIDLLGRSGYVLEAEQFAEAQNCLRCEEILRALLSASKIHGEVQVGERCFEQLLRLNKDDAVSDVLMEDMYMGVG